MFCDRFWLLSFSLLFLAGCSLLTGCAGFDNSPAVTDFKSLVLDVEHLRDDIKHLRDDVEKVPNAVAKAAVVIPHAQVELRLTATPPAAQPEHLKPVADGTPLPPPPYQKPTRARPQAFDPPADVLR